jgi:GDP-L-fucose synthase
MILVLGSTGFVGKSMIKKLEDEGIDYVASTHDECDLQNKKATYELFQKYKPDVVINLAAFLGGVHFGIKHAAEMFVNNMEMQINILEACRKYEVKRLINPIGSCVYPGDLEVYEEDKLWDGCIHESVLPFAIAKKSFVVACEAYRKQYGLDSINLVMSNMYGPGDHFDEERAHAVGGMIKRFLDAKKNNEKKFVVYGTGKPIREWLYIDDAVDALYRAISCEPIVDLINVGERKGYSIKETAKIIAYLVGFEGEIVFDTSWPDGALVKTVDGCRAQKMLGWKANMPFEEGLKKTVQWYMENYDE